MSKNNNQKFFKGFNKFRLRNSLSNKINKIIKYRYSKQPLKWNFKNELIEKKINFIKNEIDKSEIIKSLIDSKEIDALLKFKKPDHDKEKILRLYSIAVFEKFYGCSLK